MYMVKWRSRKGIFKNHGNRIIFHSWISFPWDSNSHIIHVGICMYRETIDCCCCFCTWIDSREGLNAPDRICTQAGTFFFSSLIFLSFVLMCISWTAQFIPTTHAQASLDEEYLLLTKLHFTSTPCVYECSIENLCWIEKKNSLLYTCVIIIKRNGSL